MDFAEHSTCSAMDKIQSENFNATPVTLHLKLWKGFSDKIICIHVRLFKSVVYFYYVNRVIISYQFLFTSSFIQNMSFLDFQKA